MKAKQIFSLYNHENHKTLGESKYCSLCGTKCLIKEDGGRERFACPECGFIHYKNPYPAVSVLIVDGDQVLLGKRTTGSFKGDEWCLPCGFIEFDEDFLTAAIREVKEETNLDIEIKSVINVAFNFLSPSIHTLVIVLLAEKIEGELCAGDDLSDLKWFNINDTLPDIAFEADKHIIERYFKTQITGLPIDSDFTSKNRVK